MVQTVTPRRLEAGQARVLVVSVEADGYRCGRGVGLDALRAARGDPRQAPAAGGQG